MLDELIATDGVHEDLHLAGPVGVMALHGGLEAGTVAAARAVAAGLDASLYAVIQPDDLRWHVPSTRFDPQLSPRLRTFLDGVRLAISFHGFGRRGLEHTVLVGGRNRPLAGQVGAALRAAGIAAIDDLSAIPRRLRGQHPDNPVNLPPEAGIQLELSPQVRSGAPLRTVTDVVVEVVRDFESDARWDQPA